MYWRLIDEKGNAHAVTSNNETDHTELFLRTEEVVRDAFTLCKQDIPAGGDTTLTPEALSDKTIRRIDAMASALETCRKLMIESDAAEDSEWASAIYDASKALDLE